MALWGRSKEERFAWKCRHPRCWLRLVERLVPNATPCASPALVFRGPISLARTLAPAACGAPACCSRPSGTAAARCTATAPSNAPPRPSPCHLGSIMSSGNNAMICKALYATLQISIRSCGAVERIAGRTKPPPPKTQPSAMCKLLRLLVVCTIIKPCCASHRPQKSGGVNLKLVNTQ